MYSYHIYRVVYSFSRIYRRKEVMGIKEEVCKMMVNVSGVQVDHEYVQQHVHHIYQLLYEHRGTAAVVQGKQQTPVYYTAWSIWSGCQKKYV